VTNLRWPALALGAGLLLGWILWGRSPSPATVQAAIDRAERAESLAAQNSQTVALLTQQASDLTQRADSLSRLAAIPRQQARRAVDTVLVRLGRGDSTNAIASLLGAFRGCEAAARLDSLALTACRASGAAKDSALALLTVSNDSLRAAGLGSVAVLTRLKPTRWAAGVLLERGGPVGGYLERDVWMLRLGVQLTDGANEPATIRVSAGIRF